MFLLIPRSANLCPPLAQLNPLKNLKRVTSSKQFILEKISCVAPNSRNFTTLNYMVPNKNALIYTIGPKPPQLSIFFDRFGWNSRWNLVHSRQKSYYKLKTNAAAKARWRSIGSGQYERLRPGKSHLNTGVSRSRLRRLAKPALSTGSQARRLLKLMPYSKTLKKVINHTRDLKINGAKPKGQGKRFI